MAGVTKKAGEIGELKMTGSTKKRYRTVFTFNCEKGHKNIYDSRVYAESLQNAQILSVEEVKKSRCNWCDSGPTGALRMMKATEEISFYPAYWVLGYTCQCGEKVRVLETEEDRSNDLPDKITVSCSRGHERTVLNQDLFQLEWWTEQTN